MNLKNVVVFAITITIELSVSLFLGFGEIFKFSEGEFIAKSTFFDIDMDSLSISESSLTYFLNTLKMPTHIQRVWCTLTVSL